MPSLSANRIVLCTVDTTNKPIELTPQCTVNSVAMFSVSVLQSWSITQNKNNFQTLCYVTGGEINVKAWGLLEFSQLCMRMKHPKNSNVTTEKKKQKIKENYSTLNFKEHIGSYRVYIQKL